jgi:predicted aminopeptidase
VEASGYSTLGWFDDPLPSGILERDRVGIVSFLFHELLHQTLYVPGRIAFNETLASAVSARMTEQFFRERDDDEALDLLRERSERWLDQALLCDGLAKRLERYFREEAEDTSGRDEIYRSAMADFRRLRLVAEAKEGVAQPDLNNAWFLAVWRYRKGAARFVSYLHGSRLEGTEDPYEVLPPAPS